MSNHILQKSLPIYMSMLMGQMGYRVRFFGEQAMIDYKSKEVTLPAGDFSDVDYRRLVMGAGIHEAGHGKFTVQKERPKPPMDQEVQQHPALAAEFELGRGFYNVLEDVRQERETIADVPGTRYALDDVIECAKARGWFEIPAVEEGPLALLRAYCLFQARSQYRGQNLLNELVEVKKRLVGQVPEDLVDAITQKMAEIDKPGVSTKDATRIGFEMVKIIKEKMKDLLDQQQQQQQQQSAGDQSGQPQGDQGQSQQSQPGQSSSGDAGGTQSTSANDPSSNGQDQKAQGSADSNGSSASSNAGGDQSDQRAQSGNGKGHNGKDESSSDGSDQKDSNSSSNGAGGQGAGSGNHPGSLDEAIKNLSEILANQLRGGPDRASDMGNVLGEAINQMMADPKHRAAARSMDLRMDSSDEVEPKRTHDLSAIRQRIARSTRHLAGHLQTLLEAQTTDDISHDDFGVDLDVERATRLLEGKRDVFKEVDEASEVDTAVMLLLDRSGSMSSQIGTAVDAAASAALAVERVPDCSVGVACFPGNQQQVSVINPLGEAPSKNLARFDTSAGGGTPTAEALWWAAHRLANTSHQRKMVAVITDGQPNNPEGTKTVTNLLRQAGIEVFGIGIGTQGAAAVKKLWPNASVGINSIDELPRQLFGLLRSSFVLRYN